MENDRAKKDEGKHEERNFHKKVTYWFLFLLNDAFINWNNNQKGKKINK
jgi:hypothetical protein